MFKRYKPFFRTGVIDFLAYKFSVFSWLLVTIFEVAIVIFLWIAVYNSDLECEYTNKSENAEVELSITKDILSEIVSCRMTFQRAFMAGEMKVKGDFSTMRLLDQLFVFGSNVNAF